jgi:hypothetical protein
MSNKRVFPPTASFVCSVLERKVPVWSRRTNGISAVSTSRISPTSHLPGPVADMTQTLEREISFRFYVDLRNARQQYSTGSSGVMMRRCAELML